MEKSLKTLLHSIVWVPEDQPKRLESLKKHLSKLLGYSGTHDILITVNGPHEYLEFPIGPNIILDKQLENRGWSWARNSAIKKTLEDKYDLLIMLDGDIWVEDNDWISKAQEASLHQPVFMCRMKELECMKGGRLRYKSHNWELYDEWLGCINVVTRDVLEVVGGYDFINLPRLWGYNDCLWGRQLQAAGFLKPFSGFYPSLSGLGVVEEQDSDYDKFLDPVKQEAVNSYNRAFWKLANEIMSGKRSYYFDYNFEQEIAV